MRDDLIRIEFKQNHLADIAKGVLHANGIECEMLPAPIEGDRGAMILIHEKDAAIARELLNSSGMEGQNEVEPGQPG